MTLDLQDKLYTSTQVADILGVSLRTLYRYMEDGRIQSMRTASGRHRFTKDHITEFLNAGNFDPQDLVENERMGAPIQNTNASSIQSNQYNNGFAPTATPTRYPYQQPQYTNYQNQEFAESRVAPSVPVTPAFPNTNESNQYKTFGEYRPQAQAAAPVNSQRQNFAGELPVTNQNPFKNDIEAEDVFFSPSSRNSFLKTPVYAENKDPFANDVEPTAYQRESDPVAQKPVENIYNKQVEQRSERSEINENRPYDNRQAQPATDNNLQYQQNTYRPQFDPAPKALNEMQPKETEINSEPTEVHTPKLNIRYYKSDLSDLLELARKIKDVGKARDLEYAFTLFAGLSLHFFIKPFTMLHFYANPEDMQIWREDLRLNPVTNKDEANIGILVNTDIIFIPNRDIAGFRVVEDKLLLRDLSDIREGELVKQFRQHLMSN